MGESKTVITYGGAHRCELTADCITTVTPDEARFPPVADPASAVREAIAHPRGFPPLASAVVPGDRVAVVICPGTPAAASAALGAVAGLLDAGVDPELTTVVSTAPLAEPRLQHALRDFGAESVQFEVHQPHEEDACAIVGITKSGEALRVNRTIAEAEFILPLMPAGETSLNSSESPLAGLYPAFADADAQRRFGRDIRRSGRAKLQQAINPADEAAWLLGISFAVQIVPTAGGEGIAGVYAGEPHETHRAASERRAELFSQPAPPPCELVVATVDLDRANADADDLRRALQSATSVAAPDGAAVVCGKFDEAACEGVRRALERLETADHELPADDDLQRFEPIARTVREAVQRGSVFLCSGLPPELVEDLGMTPIESDAQLARLVAERRQCLVVENAHQIEFRTSAVVT